MSWERTRCFQCMGKKTVRRRGHQIRVTKTGRLRTVHYSVVVECEVCDGKGYVTEKIDDS